MFTFILLEPARWLCEFVFYVLGVVPFRSMVVLGALIAALVSVAFALAFVRRCPRIGPALLFGTCFGAGFAIGLRVMSFLLDSRAALPTIDDLLSTVFVIVSFAIGGALLLLAVRFILGRFVNTIEQDGTLCWTCAYAMRSLERCPECGTLATPRPTVRTRALNSKPGLAFGVALWLFFLGLVAYRVWDTSTVRQFTSSALANEPVMIHPMFGLKYRGPNAIINEAWEALAVCKPVVGDATKALCIVHSGSRAPNQPAMQLQLLAARPGPAALRPDFCDPIVLCNLDDDEMSEVIAHGVPESLVRAMVDAAASAGWAPLPAGATSLGRFLEISAAGHFDSEGGTRH